MSAFDESTGSIGMPVMDRRLSKSSSSNGLPTATRRTPSVRSSGITTCLLAKGRESVRVMSAMSRVSGSIFWYLARHCRAQISLILSWSRVRPARPGTGKAKSVTSSTGETSYRRPSPPRSLPRRERVAASFNRTSRIWSTVMRL